MKRNILKAVSALLAVSLVLSLASCKKPDKNDQTQQKKRSGTRITEDSPWFDCMQYDLTPPIDTNRET